MVVYLIENEFSEVQTLITVVICPQEPPPIVHQILKAVLAVFYHDKAKAGDFDDWGKCKQVKDTASS